MGASIETFKMTLTIAIILLSYFTVAEESTSQNAQVIQDEFKRSPSEVFNAADLNSDRKVNWAEIKATFGKELHELEWDEQDVFRSFDADNDMSLDNEEFQTFHGDLQDKLEVYRLPELSLAKSAGPPPKPTEYKKISNAPSSSVKLTDGESVSSEEVGFERSHNYEENKISAVQ